MGHAPVRGQTGGAEFFQFLALDSTEIRWLRLAVYPQICSFNCMSIFEPATTLRDIRRYCSPKALDTNELNSFYVDTLPARDPHRGVRQSIKSLLEDAGPSKRILVFGHPGCGKSTELVRLTQELSGDWLCVNFSIQQEVQMIGVKAEEVLLAITHQIILAAKKAGLDSMEGDEKIKKVYDWFTTTTNITNSERQAELAMGAGVKAGTGGWLVGLGVLFAKFSSEIKFRSSTESSVVEKVRKHPGDLVEQINRIL